MKALIKITLWIFSHHIFRPFQNPQINVTGI
jgi:hypothetical protein